MPFTITEIKKPTEQIQSMSTSKARTAAHVERAQGGGRVIFQAGGGTLIEPPISFGRLKESNVLVVCIDPDRKNAWEILERAKSSLSSSCKEVKTCRLSELVSDFTQHSDFGKVVEFSPNYVIFILPLEGYSDQEFSVLNENIGRMRLVIPDVHISIFYGNVLGDDGSSDPTLSMILTNADAIRPVRECRNMVTHLHPIELI